MPEFELASDQALPGVQSVGAATATAQKPARLTSHIDAMPLLKALEAIRDAGRRRKEQGTDDVAVSYARLANHALLWFDKDQEGDLELANDHLDAAYRLMSEI